MKKFIGRYLQIIVAYAQRYSRMIWAVIIGLIGFFLARIIYFGDNPLLDLVLLGEVLVGIVLFLLVFFFGVTVVRFVGEWFENVLYKTFSRILSEFWRVYSNRLVDTVVRKQNGEDGEDSDARRKIYKDAVLLDTSTIIDGRILGVIETGFLDRIILVSQNVLDELQNMADKSNTMKRQKARRGLDVLNDIKELVGKSKFKVVEIGKKSMEVDKSLVEFCKENGSKIATVDYNLNKVARVAGVDVLNVNKLANEIKTNLLPGEVLLLKVVQEGKEADQGVGYLEDGTMVVVKDGIGFVGDETQVMVDKVLQTSAGRMVFASVC